MDEGYKELAAAIVERAVWDYRIAVSENNSAEIYKIEKFFRSDWFCQLSDLDGKTIIRKIKNMEVSA